MNCINDERIKFYLEHEDRIKEWVAIGKDVPEFAHRFYLSLQDDVDKAISRSPDWEAVSCVRPNENHKWPQVGLRGTSWPDSPDVPDGGSAFSPKIVIEWHRASTGFSAGHLVCGAHVGDYVAERSGFDSHVDLNKYPGLDKYPEGPNAFWFRYRRLKRPDPCFWKDDGLAKYRKYLLDQLCKAWTDLAPLMDEAAKRARE